jgi:hypothetical protein
MMDLKLLSGSQKGKECAKKPLRAQTSLRSFGDTLMPGPNDHSYLSKALHLHQIPKIWADNPSTKGQHD